MITLHLLHRIAVLSRQTARAATYTLRAFANGRRRLAQSIAGQFLVIDARYFDMDVNTIKQRTADALLVTQHIRQRAGTLFHRVVVVATRTGILRSDEHKVATINPAILGLKSCYSSARNMRARKTLTLPIIDDRMELALELFALMVGAGSLALAWVENPREFLL